MRYVIPSAAALVAMSASSVCAAAEAVAAPVHRLYSVFEHELRNPTPFANPFTDTELRLSVRAPTERRRGASFEWIGFHDGDGRGGQAGDVWKFRVLLDTPGEWRIDYRFVDPRTGRPQSGPAGHVTVRVDGADPVGHGHLGVDPGNWMRLAFDDGTPWVPLPIHASMLLDVDQPTARHYLDEAAAVGVSALTVRFHAEAEAKGFRDRSYFPWLAPSGERVTGWQRDPENTRRVVDPAFDFTRFDVATWRHQEQIIRYAEQKNIHLSIWFGISGLNPQYQSYGPRDYPDDRTLGDRQKLLIRYLLARWAALPTWWHWSIDSEYEETGRGADERVLAFAEYMRQVNPWGTLLTTHVLRNWTLGRTDAMDLVTLQRRVIDTDAGATDCRVFIAENLIYGKPVYNAEGVWSLQNVTRSRIATLAHVFAGGYSHIAHGGGPSSSWFVDWDKLSSRHHEDARMLGRLDGFFNHSPGIDINPALPRHDRVTLAGGHLAMCLADEGLVYYVWLDEGGTATLDLTRAPGRFAVTRYAGDALDRPEQLDPIEGGRTVRLPAAARSGFGHDTIYVVRNLDPRAVRLLTLLTADLPAGAIGHAVDQGLSASQTGRPVTWRMQRGALPPGVRLQDGRLRGTPTEAGSYPFTLAATDGASSDERDYVWRILPEPVPMPGILHVRLTDMTADGAVVQWRTTRPTDGRVQWGEAVGQYTHDSGVVEQQPTQNHRVPITGPFEAGQEVHFLIIAADAFGRTVVYSDRATIRFTE